MHKHGRPAVQVLSKAEGSDGETDKEVHWEASSCHRGQGQWCEHDAEEVLHTVGTGADTSV